MRSVATTEYVSRSSVAPDALRSDDNAAGPHDSKPSALILRRGVDRVVVKRLDNDVGILPSRTKSRPVRPIDPTQHEMDDS